MDADQDSDAPVGTRLASARAAAGLSLAEVATATRIQQRHLAALEAGDFAALPGRPYAIGFARTYARAVGLDERAIAEETRAELDGGAFSEDAPAAVTFSPGDPARVPNLRTAVVAGIAAVAVAAGAWAWWHRGDGDGALPSILPSPAHVVPHAGPAPHPAAPTGGPVVFTATVPDLWVKFYDASGRQLMQKQMAQGESYTVPADAAAPLLWTGRPEALAITVGGRQVPRLADTQHTVKDVPVSAAALLARAMPTAAPAPAAGPTSAPSAAPVRRRAAAPARRDPDDVPLPPPVVGTPAAPQPGTPQ